MSKKIIVIAGAGPGLGRALAEQLTGEGHDVVTLSRSPRDAAAPTAAGPAGRGSFRALAADVTDRGSLERALSGVIAAAGAVDALIYNAAPFLHRPFLDTRPEEFEHAWRTTLQGAVHCAQIVLPGMLQRGSGTLLFTGATASLRGGPGFAAFAAAKFALRGLAQSLAREYQPAGIHVAHIVLDGIIGGTPSMARSGMDAAKCLDPAGIAKAYAALLAQDKTALTHELDLRPHTERF